MDPGHHVRRNQAQRVAHLQLAPPHLGLQLARREAALLVRVGKGRQAGLADQVGLGRADGRHVHLAAADHGDRDADRPLRLVLAQVVPVTLVGESRRRHTFVAERDVAAFAVAAVRSPDARNATVLVGGPDALTLRDVVQAYEEMASRPIPVRTVAPGEPIPGVPEAVWGLAAALESFDSPIPMEETARRYGVELTTVRDFVRSRLGRREWKG